METLQPTFLIIPVSENLANIGAAPSIYFFKFSGFGRASPFTLLSACPEREFPYAARLAVVG
jgi:hypothetical protein